jgi:hypothetical protein
VTEMELLTRFRAEVPARVSPEATRRFHAALDSERARPLRPADPTLPRRSLPLLRLGVAGGLAAAAAAIVVAVPHWPASRPPARQPSAAALPTVQQLAFRASTAALAAKPVSPGQWVYEKSTVTIIAPKGGHRKDVATENWQTANGLRSAWYYHGQLGVYSTPAEGKDISYAELAKLPSNPPALAKYIYGREQEILGPEPANLNWQMTFNEIAGLFNYFVLPPKVAAALFQAIPRIPGVQIVKEADSIAFTRSYGQRDTEKVILNPHTYTVTGTVLADPASGFAKQVTFSARVPVSGPGVRP